MFYFLYIEYIYIVFTILIWGDVIHILIFMLYIYIYIYIYISIYIKLYFFIKIAFYNILFLSFDFELKCDLKILKFMFYICIQWWPKLLETLVF